MVDVSGVQTLLTFGDYRAIIASVGASLRSLTYKGRDLTVPYEAGEVRPGYRGVTLVPWPNRIVDGQYVFAGALQELPLTEPARGHALHGLAVWSDYNIVRASETSVTLETIVQAQTGYPWQVRVETTYELAEDGLTQTVVGENLSGSDAPWGTAPHPYLVAGHGAVDEWTLTLPAASVLSVDDRLAPVALASVEGSERFDFRTPRVIGRTEIDHAYTAVDRQDGVATVALTAPEGTGAQMTWGEQCDWVQIHTADLPHRNRALGHRAGLAVEPMTCAPDAFNSGEGLVVLSPGARHSAWWRISAL